ncbi:MAG: molybdopterin dinucleotide binding domain-containing protein, partial [Dehalococcoidia bacterium]|nr:molybdopterin dinucleotide binding domain-containing protein [Dehalococcoidia bacterium]
IGIHGGDTAARSWDSIYGGYPYQLGRGISSGGNPVEDGAPPRPYALTGGGARMGTSGARVHITMVPDAILKGKAGGYPADYRLAYLVNINYLNQTANLNKTIEAFKKLEFIAVQEQFMTATAKFADIILPTNTYFERNDITAGGAPPFYGAMNKAIESLYESKSHLEIGEALAGKLGIKNFNEKSEGEWLRSILKDSPIQDTETFKKSGSYKVKLSEPYVLFKDQIEEPEKHPFPTPSGKIELFSQRIADMNHPLIPPVPKYIETWESPNDPLARKYPLQLITTHTKTRAHTQFDNIPWLKEVLTQKVSINSLDAKSRKIKDGDHVRIFNDRGQMVLPARVCERIMPGVVEIPQGAWYEPDDKGVDRGGCANVLTNDEISPGGAFASNTTLVQIEKVIN